MTDLLVAQEYAKVVPGSAEDARLAAIQDVHSLDAEQVRWDQPFAACRVW